jgi:phosphoglycolate phosphatase
MTGGNGLRLVVFDVDGTLIDSQAVIIASMRGAFAAAGHPAPPDATILSIVGLSLPVAVAALAPEVSEADRAGIVAAYREEFAASRLSGGGERSAPLYPGAREALETLGARPSTLLGVATGKARRGLDHVFAAHGIGHHFVTAQTADDHPSKPHPSMLEQALRETGCDAGAAVMIGDTEFDVVMGRAAGFATVGVAWGYHPRERLLEAGADVVIDRFGELAAALDALWGATA